jgi:hypothetical protein
MSTTQRILHAAVGLVLVIAGAAIIYAFHTLPQSRGHDLWDAGFLLITEAYSIAGSLFILLGLRYALGETRFIERTIGRSLRHFVVAVVLLSLVTLAAVLFAFR